MKSTTQLSGEMPSPKSAQTQFQTIIDTRHLTWAHALVNFYINLVDTLDDGVIFPGTQLTVRWLPENGEYPFQTYYRDFSPTQLSSFVAVVKEMGEHSHISASSRGHLLRGAFNKLWEFKTKSTRALGFRDGTDFYVVSVVPKQPTTKRQEPDYARALAKRTEYFSAKDNARK